MTEKPKTELGNIQMLVMDVDGVLTDGNVLINDDGDEGKFFNLLDGHGIRMWRRAGMKVAFLSGRQSKATKCRAEQLEVDYCINGCKYKLPELKKLIESANLSMDNIAYVGDDLMDLAAVRLAGFGVAVANAVDEVKQQADYVTNKPGGRGAVREVIEYILKKTGRWCQLMDRYTPSNNRK